VRVIGGLLLTAAVLALVYWPLSRYAVPPETSRQAIARMFYPFHVVLISILFVVLMAPAVRAFSRERRVLWTSGGELFLAYWGVERQRVADLVSVERSEVRLLWGLLRLRSLELTFRTKRYWSIGTLAMTESHELEQQLNALIDPLDAGGSRDSA
jgi:hypothetical protein